MPSRAEGERGIGRWSGSGRGRGRGRGREEEKKFRGAFTAFRIYLISLRRLFRLEYSVLRTDLYG